MTLQLSARHRPRYELLTFYKFVDLPPRLLPLLAQEHLDFCRDIGLRGRVYLGREGISATVSGNRGQTHAYRLYLQASPYFHDIADIDSKASPVDGHQFPRMSVKLREEIVALGHRVTAAEVERFRREISPGEFKAILDGPERENYLILDMRNDYEYRLGHFKHALPAGTVNFREVPALLERYRQQAAGKKIIWYCTGGIRCEKAAVLANQLGAGEFYALQGGVVKYVNQFNDGNWLGNLYTFDDRVSTPVGDEHTHRTIGRCCYSDQPSDHCENCRHAPCNAHLIARPREYRRHGGFCSTACYAAAQEDGLVRAVAWDDFDYRAARRAGRWDELRAHLQSLVPANLRWRHAHSQREECRHDDG